MRTPTTTSLKALSHELASECSGCGSEFGQNLKGEAIVTSNLQTLRYGGSSKMSQKPGLALAQQLPGDVLYLIFRLILPAEFDNRGSMDVRTISPFSLSLVCRSWRTVVDNHPSLWSFFSVLYDSSAPPHTGCLISPLINHWINRSASASLSLDIRFLYDDPTIESNEIFTLLTAQQQRWDAVSIFVESTPSRLDETIVIPCPPTLSSLDVAFAGLRSMHGPGTPIVLDLSRWETDIVSFGARLHTLTTNWGVGWRLPPQSKALHFPSIRELDISTNLGRNIGDTFGALRACPCLSVLRLEAEGTTLFNVGEEPIVLLPNLTFLDIQSRNQAVARHFLDHISSPKLVSFAYWLIPSTTEREEDRESDFTLQHINSFVRFFKRSHCPPLRILQLLSLSNSAVSSVETSKQYLMAIKELVGMLGNLEVLRLQGVAIDDELMKMLTITEGLEPLCPSLEKLTISLRGQFQLHWHAVEDMVVSRWSDAKNSETRKLCSLWLYDPNYKEPDKTCVRLRKCIEEGFCLYSDDND